jgi:toxin ParE1/3/4
VIQWADEAQMDFAGLLGWLNDRNPSAAADVAEEVLAAVERLARFPHSGRVGRRTGTRELAIPGRPYLVIYQTHGGIVSIVRLLHGAQNWPSASEAGG